MPKDRISSLFLAEVRRDLLPYAGRVRRCLQLLSEREIWWRPNGASNSAGNLVLHLCGNMRQWILAGLGGEPDLRERDAEFAERGPNSKSAAGRKDYSRRGLLRRLDSTMRETDTVLRRLSPEALTRRYVIQGFQVTGLAAVAHVYSHFTYHAGQILYLTKLRHGRDLRFTKLPPQAKRSPDRQRAARKASR